MHVPFAQELPFSRVLAFLCMLALLRARSCLRALGFSRALAFSRALPFPRALPFFAACLAASLAAGAGHAEIRTVTRGDAAIECRVDGRGPAVLMIASLGRPAEDFDALAARVAGAGYTAVRPQPRGVGASRGPMQGLTLHDLALDALACVPDPTGRVVAIGHAFGQRVARTLATEWPERVAGVVMLAAGGKAAMKPGAREALTAVFDPTLPADRHLHAVEVAFFAPGNDPAVWRNGWFAPVAQMQSAATRASPVERWWSAGRAPMLVVQGVQDAVAPPENGRALAAEFGARVILHEIDGAGHAMLPERPEEIAARVLEFLARVAR